MSRILERDRDGCGGAYEMREEGMKIRKEKKYREWAMDIFVEEGD
jgi:hypothetical protein